MAAFQAVIATATDECVLARAAHQVVVATSSPCGRVCETIAMEAGRHCPIVGDIEAVVALAPFRLHPAHRGRIDARLAPGIDPQCDIASVQAVGDVVISVESGCDPGVVEHLNAGRL